MHRFELQVLAFPKSWRSFSITVCILAQYQRRTRGIKAVSVLEKCALYDIASIHGNGLGWFGGGLGRFGSFNGPHYSFANS